MATVTDVSIERPLFIHISPHGLIRGTNPELGRDLDTGGQVSYVLELSRTLAKHGDVILMTRLIEDPTSDPPLSHEYAQPEEELCNNAKIVRLRCGPKRYLRKELLWDVLHSFVDRALEYILTLRRRPTILHGHYADGAFVAQMLADVLAVPMAFTGHSMGRTKMKSLLKSETSFPKLNAEFKLRRRIEAEERAILTTSLVIANSQTEINHQWRALYDGFHALENVFSVNALRPGVGMDRFVLPPDGEPPRIWKEIDRRLIDPSKPVILVLARLSREKNIPTILETFGESQALQEKCNLILVVGRRCDPFNVSKGQRDLLTQILLLNEKYDLEGKLVRPKAKTREEIRAIFGLPAHRGGVFVNVSLREPFGLTLIEAAVNGAPLIATKNDAGPEIVHSLQNGLTVDPLDKQAIEAAILSIVSNGKSEKWLNYHENSLKNSAMYSWDGHVERYLGMVESCQNAVGTSVIEEQEDFDFGEDSVLIITDIDDTLLGPTKEAQRGFRQFLSIIRQNSHKFKLALATGRSIESTVQYIHEYDSKLIEECVFIISSVGSEIHYLNQIAKERLESQHSLNLRPEVWDKFLEKDESYDNHVSFRFDPDGITDYIDLEWPELQLQGYETGHPPSEQRRFKVSYVIREDRLTRQHRSDLCEEDEPHSLFPAPFQFLPNKMSGSPSVSGGSASPPSFPFSNVRASRPPDSFDDYTSASPPSDLATREDTPPGIAESEDESMDITITNPTNSVDVSMDFTHLSPPLLESKASSGSLFSLDNESVASASSRGSTSSSRGSRLTRRRSSDPSNLNRHLHRHIPELLRSDLRASGFMCNVIDSHGKYVDILPIRASKGKAIRYLLARYNVKFDKIVTCGDSGNDLDMLQGNTKAIVVANRDRELRSFLNSQHNHDCVHYSSRKYAHGIIEGLQHYGFLSAAEVAASRAVP